MSGEERIQDTHLVSSGQGRLDSSKWEWCHQPNISHVGRYNDEEKRIKMKVEVDIRRRWPSKGNIPVLATVLELFGKYEKQGCTWAPYTKSGQQDLWNRSRIAKRKESLMETEERLGVSDAELHVCRSRALMHRSFTFNVSSASSWRIGCLDQPFSNGSYTVVIGLLHPGSSVDLQSSVVWRWLLRSVRIAGDTRETEVQCCSNTFALLSAGTSDVSVLNTMLKWPSGVSKWVTVSVTSQSGQSTCMKRIWKSKLVRWGERVMSNFNSSTETTLRSDNLSADLVLRLLSRNHCAHFYFTLTRPCTTAMLTTLALDRYKQKTVESGIWLSIFWQERTSGACVSNAQVAIALGSQRWAKRTIRRKKSILHCTNV